MDKVDRPPLAQGLPRLAPLLRLPQQGIVNVGEVLDVCHTHAAILKVAYEDVRHGIGEQMPKMRGVIRGDPTHIHSEVAIVCVHGLHCLAQRVV